MSQSFIYDLLSAPPDVVTALDQRAKLGEIPGGTAGKSIEAQERLAEGMSLRGTTRKGFLGSD